MEPDALNLTENVEQLVEIGSTLGPTLVRAVLLLLIVLLLSKYLGRFLSMLLIRAGMPERRALVPVTGLHVVVLLIGALVVLSMLGFPGKMLFRWLLGAAMLLLSVFVIVQPYIPKLPLKRGDFVRLGSALGTVDQITLMHTVLKTLDGKMEFVPNHQVLNMPMTNFSLNPERRLDVELFIPYGQNLEEVKSIVSERLRQEELVLEEPAPRGAISKFSPSYREMVARFWVDGRSIVAAGWAVNERIDAAFEEAGISMAAPRIEVVHGTEELAPAGHSDSAG